MPTNFVSIFQAVSKMWTMYMGPSAFDQLWYWLTISMVFAFAMRVMDDLING